MLGFTENVRIGGSLYAGMEVRESKAERINSRVRRLTKDRQVPVTREGEEKMNQKLSIYRLSTASRAYSKDC